MMINDVHRGINKNKKSKRLGRGPGSGHGKTSGKGHKGQKSRSGTSWSSVFQGGAMPLVRRVPKRGFHNKFALEIAVINVGDLQNLFNADDEVSPDVLKSRGIVKHPYDQLKVLGNGELTTRLKVAAHRFSRTAREQIEKAGGEVVLLPGPAPVKANLSKKAAGHSPGKPQSNKKTRPTKSAQPTKTTEG